MNETAVIQTITDTFDDVQLVTVGGATFFFYGLERMFPFATLVTEDDDYDHVSNLNRPGIFRLNIGVSRDTYRTLFGPETPRAGADGIVETGHDFTALDQLLPHPVYAPQSWVSVLNPSETTFAKVVRPLLDEAFDRAVRRQAKAAT